jgi:hypothetical protein
VCIAMAVVLPVSLDAQETAAAMLRSSGSGVLVNKNPAPTSIALFPNDLIETPQNAVARIELSGSAADINADTVVQFDGDELVLDHGSLSVNTTLGLRVRVGCLTVTPVNVSQWTQYNVSDLDGKVTVSAAKSDVYIDSRAKKAQEAKNPSRSTRDIVRESEQKSREEKCGAAYTKRDNVPGLGALMNSPYAIWGGTAVIGAVTCWVLCRTDNPASPSKP